MDPVHVIVLTDEESGHEALYVGGDLVDQCDTIYACDIGRATEGKTINFTHMSVRIPDGIEEYPQRFEDTLLWPGVNIEP